MKGVLAAQDANSSAISQLITWLPPLNSHSHNNSHVTVHAVQGDHLVFNPHKQPGLLSLRFHVDVVFHSGDFHRTIPALATLVDIATYSLETLSYHKYNFSDMLPCYVPFQVDKAYYTETRLFSMKPQPKGINKVVKMNIIIKLLYDFLNDVVRESQSAGYEEAQADITITKWIQLPPHELQAYKDLYEAQDKEEYMKAISRPRKMDELFEDEVVYKAVAKECERVNYLQNREIFDVQTCCVCLDKLGGGAK